MRKSHPLLIAVLLCAGCHSRELRLEAEDLLARHPESLSHTELSRVENVRVNTNHDMVCGSAIYRGDGIMGNARLEERYSFVYQRHRDPLLEFKTGRRVTPDFLPQWRKCHAG